MRRSQWSAILLLTAAWSAEPGGEMTTKQTTPALQPYILSAGRGQNVKFLATHMSVKATAEQTGGDFGFLESMARPGFSPPLHIHHREHEAMWVIDGEVTFKCGDEILEAGPGSFVFLPRGIPHTFVIEGDTPARMLVLCTPGGFEGYHIEGGTPAVDDNIPASFDPAQLDILRALHHKYEEEHVGPPIKPRGERC
jgi:mannose-6-phosphate isomerase-like protein (cupin superfamily)